MFYCINIKRNTGVSSIYRFYNAAENDIFTVYDSISGNTRDITYHELKLCWCINMLSLRLDCILVCLMDEWVVNAFINTKVTMTNIYSLNNYLKNTEVYWCKCNLLINEFTEYGHIIELAARYGCLYTPFILYVDNKFETFNYKLVKIIPKAGAYIPDYWAYHDVSNKLQGYIDIPNKE